MSQAPFPIDPRLSQIALAYRNQTLIADQVLPRVPVGKEEFKWLKHTKEEGFTVPDTTTGRKGRVNEVSFTASEETSSTRDYGLEDAIPQSDITNAAGIPGYDPLSKSTEMLSNLIALDREVRVAATVFAAATYPIGNKATLSGTSQWSHVDSDPVKAILTALDSMLIRPNIATFGQAVWTQLRQHPKVVKATNRNSGDSGVAARQAVAELLELEEILVGQGFVNTAKPGQTASMSRVWGKHASFIYRNQMAAPMNDITFGMTAEFGTRIAGSWEDRNIGLRGGTRVRAGESVREIITASDVGYFFENAVA